MNWLSLFKRSTPPLVLPDTETKWWQQSGPSGTRTAWQKPFLKSKWMIKVIPGWCQLTVNNRADGKRQFLKLLVGWSIKDDGSVFINFKFDRKLTFSVSKRGINLLKIYNKPRGGDVILIVKTATREVRKDDKIILH